MEFINVICNWYRNLSIHVKWNHCYATRLIVNSGVRQGGILSLILFNMYVDCILSEFKNKGLGCCVHKIYVGCIKNADDLQMLSSSIIDLQVILNVTGKIGCEIGLIFNCAKSKCIVIGREEIRSSCYIDLR